MNALKGCVDGWFLQLNYAEVILDGRGGPLANLADYALTTRPVTLPPNNLISPVTTGCP